MPAMPWIQNQIRSVLTGLAAMMVLGLSPIAALAQGDAAKNFPAKPVRLMVNFPAGGPSDILARSVADGLQTLLKQPFIVENKPGAGGNIGADLVAKSPPDGYTVLVSIDSTLTVNPHLYKSMPFKDGDLKPVMILASSGLMMGVTPSTGFKNLNDLVAAGKSRPINFCSGSNGSPGHLALGIFNNVTGLNLQHIPYKGNAPAATAIVAGEVDGGVIATPGLLPGVKAGKITPLAVTSRKRSTLAPDVPTVAEAGLPGLEQEIMYVAMVPKSTPDAIVQILAKAMAEVLTRPEFQTRMQALDMFYEGVTGAEAAKRLAELSTRYASIVESTGMKLE